MTAKFSKSSAAHLRSRARKHASTRSVCGLGAVLMLAACGEAEEAIEEFYGYLDSGVVLGDAGVSDSGTFIWDSSLTYDGGTYDGGVLPDAGLDSGVVSDGAVDSGAGDGFFSLNDGGGKDGGVNDGSVSDASVVDASSADASVGDASVGPLCHLENNQVVLIGDSYLDLSDDIPRLLEENARKAGALAQGKEYIDHSLSGASINGFPSIPEQWPNALAEAKNSNSKGVKLVIGTGGGNDVLVNNRPCLDFAKASDITAACKEVVTDTVVAGTKMFDQMGKDGVEDMIYFFYPHLPDGQIFGFQGVHPNTILDYAYPFVKKMCDDQVKPRCHFVDTRPPFEGKTAQYISPIDGIHPTPSGSKVIADLIWGVMQNKCLASK